MLRQNTHTFIAKTFKTVEPATYVPNWHIDLISEYLDAIVAGEVTRVIFNVPPGYTKSISVNVGFSAKLMGVQPFRRILSASHSYQLSLKMSNKTRSVVQAPWYQATYPDMILKTDVENRQDLFSTTQNGYRQAVSVGGKITGGGGDVLMIDDPLDATDAAAVSGAAVRAANDWFNGTFYSRLRDKKKGIIIVIMQRLLDMDLTGMLQGQMNDKFEICKIPAIEDTPGGRLYTFGNFSYHRPEGEVLCDAIEGPKEMAAAKERLGTFGFASQYQQEPAPKEGGLVKKEWFQYYDFERGLPTPVSIVQSWDTAVKADQIHDYSVCTTWYVAENGFYLVDVLRQRMEYPELKRSTIAQSEKWKPDLILIEDKASGQALIQELQTSTQLPIMPTMPVQDKITRLSVTTPKIEAGKVFLPKGKEWVDDYVKEMILFPNVLHDDQVDSTSQFLKWTTMQERIILRARSL